MNAPRDWTLLCLSCGAVVALSRLFSLYTSVPCTWVPGYLGTWVPGYLGTWVPGYLGTWVPGYLGTWVPGYLGTWVPGYLGTWVPGYLGTWVPGYLGTWVPGKTRTFLFAKTRTLFCDNTYTFCVRVIANRKKKYTCYRNLHGCCQIWPDLGANFPDLARFPDVEILFPDLARSGQIWESGKFFFSKKKKNPQIWPDLARSGNLAIFFFFSDFWLLSPTRWPIPTLRVGSAGGTQGGTPQTTPWGTPWGTPQI